MKFCFGDIVVVEKELIGVIVKSWVRNNESVYHEVYVRNYNDIKEYDESEIQRYMVRHKELNEEELYYQQEAHNPFISKEEIKMFEQAFNLVDTPEWDADKVEKDLAQSLVGKYIYNDDGELVEIKQVFVDRREDNQHMNRVADEYGNIHFIQDIKTVFTREDK